MCVSLGVFLGFKEKFFFCFVLVLSIASMEICQYVLMREVFFGGTFIVSLFVFKRIIIHEYSYCYQGSANLGESFPISYIANFPLNSALFS
jgi:hypothetical protein